MKTKLFTSVLATVLLALVSYGQDVTTVTATNYDISDNLDLTAVASIFGESKDLADFEYRLNNPKTQISNLDLNRDGRVDYLRVIEAVEADTHLIILQAVLGQDMYQDVATIEVEKDKRNQTVRVQVVGDVYLYGPNYIYEPVYVVRPVIFTTFWYPHYVAYYSPWYWGYYPSYYSYWAPYPIFRYRSHVCNYINVHNTYNYVTVRNSTRAVAMHNSRRSDSYARQNPRNSFTSRNAGYTNAYAMNQSRSSNGRNNQMTATSGRNNQVNGVSQRGESRNLAENTRTAQSERTLSTATNTRNNTLANGRGTVRGGDTPSATVSRNATLGNGTGTVRGVESNSSNTRTTVGTSTPTRSNNSMSNSSSSVRSSGVSTTGSANRNTAVGTSTQPSRNTTLNSSSSSGRSASMGVSSPTVRSSSSMGTSRSSGMSGGPATRSASPQSRSSR